MTEPIKKNFLSYEIVDRIMADIMSGKLKPGDRLPSERELTDIFQVSRTTIREALKLLSFSKIVESRPGAGTFILDMPTLTEQKALVHEETDFNDPLALSIEVRMVIEPKIIRLAAGYVNEQELTEFDELLKEMRNSAEGNEYGTYALLDMRFHRLCAKASKNPDLYNTLQKYCGSPQHVASFGCTVNAEMETYWQHEAIVSALRAHDPDRAEKAMCEHIFYAFKKSLSKRTSLIYSKRLRLLSPYELDIE